MAWVRRLLRSWIRVRPIWLIAVFTVLIVVSDVTAHTESGAVHKDDGKRGAFSITFTRRIFASKISALNKRVKLKLSKDASEYDIADETYELYVPPDYQPGVPYGLLVWINAIDHGRPFGHLWSVLEKRHLIWVGANNSGNDNETHRRMALALDAVYNMAKRYTIDKDRVYVAGFSGGGRVSSRLAPAYPDVFQGGFYLCGANFAAKIHKAAKGRSRFVLLTGENDFNLEDTRDVYDKYTASRFRFATLIEVPGLAHDIPDAQWFEKGIVALDRPLGAKAKKAYLRGVGFEKSKRFGDAWLAYTQAYIRGGDQDFVDQARDQAGEIRGACQGQIDQVKQLIADGQLPQAAAALGKVKRQYKPLLSDEVEALFKQISGLRKPQ